MAGAPELVAHFREEHVLVLGRNFKLFPNLIVRSFIDVTKRGLPQ
jgi:hypothetical protein